MHGTIGQQAGTKTPVNALGAGSAPATSGAPTVGKSVKPNDDPRIRSYVEG